ncbi:uncharacterized protein QC761_119940 [Podospora bellae-mahoneyi]|uniref:Myb-like domain-containing protein n=1 Tax=Podospora bellae-mahoneyi TaxID=2093777 RepID=A0ABR0G1D2_9PEZI|nr:hypothetical protein QC761_119940 [Podospora bellae-mahoneyi]
MATIEPRLIHLLNNSQIPDLPPIQSLPLDGSVEQSQSLSLPPLESDVSQRGDRNGPNQILPISTVSNNNTQLPGIGSLTEDPSSLDNPNQLTALARPLHFLLGEPEPAALSPFSLRRIVDDVQEAQDDGSYKKRHRALTTKDDFVQLPQPLKKQKSAQLVQRGVVPPIIAGLHHPPPNAAVFPPITSNPYHHGEPPNMGLFGGVEERSLPLHLQQHRAQPLPQPLPQPQPQTPSELAKLIELRAKRRAIKPRKKWTDEETNNLLLGVSKHGVGKWTNILEDSEFKFNGRSAGDLKDRFRTCCPDELRGQLVKKRSKNGNAPTPTSEPNPPSDTSRPKNGLHLDDILSGERPGVVAAEPDQQSSSAQPDSDPPPKIRKSRAHRKKMEDLVELGICGPFKKSHRRERRPFTDEDDRQILHGLEQYGPSWTKIQRDTNYNFSSRQPTDLRDRVRNKYPDVYNQIEKGTLQIADASRRNNLLEPSVNTTIEKSLASASTNPLEPQLNRSGSKEEMARWTTASSYYESTDSLPGLTGVFDMNNETGGSGINIGRLLLDDPQAVGDQMRHDGTSSSASPAADPRIPQNRSAGYEVGC